MDRIAEFRTIVLQPYAYLQKVKDQTGKKIVGTICSYAPEELIFAAGALPVRLFGSDAGIHRADLHLQSYCCSLVRGILEEALSGRLDLLDGMVFPHTCDSIQRLSDVWRLNLVKSFHADVVLPVKLNTPSAGQYLFDVLKKFKKDLEQGLNREITEAGLIHAVKTYNAIRAAMTRLYQLRCENPRVLSGQDLHTIVRAAMIMEREAFLESLAGIVAELEERAPDVPASGARRLVLSGGICNHPDIYDAIESAGGVVVGDDLCTGSRYFAGAIDENLPPLEAIAERYTRRAVCPAKHAGLTRRVDNLLKTVRDCRAEGVVFLLLKFCDPHAFDYPYMKEMLDREKIPSLLLEMEEKTEAGGQLATRLETFVQIL
ncbi:MAG: 2-hydroxyacyl-CoA dehydratase family protein [Deltaproteobacteria bacterium]